MREARHARKACKTTARMTARRVRLRDLRSCSVVGNAEVAAHGRTADASSRRSDKSQDGEARKAGQGREAVSVSERSLGVLGMHTEQRGETCSGRVLLGPDGGNPPSTRQGRSHDRTTREGASGRSLMMQYRTERKRSAVRGVQTWGELANGSEARIRRTGGRIGDGVGTKFCVLTRGGLSASAWSAVVIEEPTTR
jgi:hypothetical protein